MIEIIIYLDVFIIKIPKELLIRIYTTEKRIILMQSFLFREKFKVMNHDVRFIMKHRNLNW